MEKELKEYVLSKVDEFVTQKMPEYKRFASGKLGGGVTYRWKINKTLHFFVILMFSHKGYNQWTIAGAWTKNGKMPKEDIYIQTMEGLQNYNDNLQDYFEASTEAWLDPVYVLEGRNNIYEMAPLSDEWVDRLLQSDNPYVQELISVQTKVPTEEELKEVVGEKYYDTIPETIEQMKNRSLDDRKNEIAESYSWDYASDLVSIPLTEEDIKMAFFDALNETKQTFEAFQAAFSKISENVISH